MKKGVTQGGMRGRSSTRWTKARRVAFLAALARTANVTRSAETVGMSASSAYMLRGRDAEFARAWREALDVAVTELEHELIVRAREGVSVPIFFGGKKVGERRTYPDRLAMFLLTRHRRAPSSSEEDDGDDDVAREGAALDLLMKEIAQVSRHEGKADDDEPDA